jgi:hypothetical protein
MEKPERKQFPLFQIGNQILEDKRYHKAVKDYDEWIKNEQERQKLENESLKLQNEEKRALVESLRKQQGLGGSENLYDRVKNEKIEKPKSFLDKLNDLFTS